MLYGARAAGGAAAEGASGIAPLLSATSEQDAALSRRPDLHLDHLDDGVTAGVEGLGLLAVEEKADIIRDGLFVPALELPEEDPGAAEDRAARRQGLVRDEGLGEVDAVDPAVVPADQRVPVVVTVVVGQVLE